MPGEAPAEARTEKPGTPEYIEELEQDIERLEQVTMPTIRGKLQLTGTMDPVQNRGLEGAEMRQFNESYSELVTNRLELFLRSPETQDRIKELQREFGTISFSPAAQETIRKIFELFRFGKPNRQGQETTRFLMRENHRNRVWVGEIITHVQDIDQLLSIATPEQKDFLWELRSLFVNAEKPLSDTSWSLEEDGIMDIDPIAKAQLVARKVMIRDGNDADAQAIANAKLTPELARQEKGWSQLAITGRFMGMVAASGMAILAFFAGKRKLSWPVGLYAGLAFLAANGMPKGKLDSVMEEVKPLLSADFLRIAQTYKFREDPVGWKDIALGVNQLRRGNSQQFTKLMKPVREGKTDEEKQEGVRAFAAAIYRKDTPAKESLEEMAPQDLVIFCEIVGKPHSRDASMMMQQYIEKNLGPEKLAEL